MSDETTDSQRPITVAELLARNGQQDGSSSRAHSRRSRRGGVSVAELTGEIPVVRDVPEEPAPADDQARPEGQAQAGEPAARDQPAAQDEPATRDEPASAAEATDDAGSDRVGADTGQADSARGRGVPGRSRAEDDGVSFYAFGALSDDRGQADTRQADTRQADTRQSDTRQADTRQSEPRQWETRQWEAHDPETALQTAVLPETDAHADNGAAGAAQTAAGGTVAAEEARAASEPVEQQAEPGTEGAPKKKRSALRQWGVLAAQCVVALVVGALLFKAFEKLWDMIPYVALVLAVLVILAMVAVVRILRKTDDITSVLIAVIVGAIVTIGPLAFLLSS